jgi:hypothetical protein
MSFTAMYFLMPMFMAGGSQINFGLILMFIAAIVYDGMIKTSAEHCGPSLVKDAVGSNVVTGGGPETINMKTFMADAVGGFGADPTAIQVPHVQKRTTGSVIN